MSFRSRLLPWRWCDARPLCTYRSRAAWNPFCSVSGPHSTQSLQQWRSGLTISRYEGISGTCSFVSCSTRHRQAKRACPQMKAHERGRLDDFACLQHSIQNYSRIYVYNADSDSISILLLTNAQGCAIMKLSDREVPYQALLFKKMIGWNLMNGGGRYGIIPVFHPMPYASEKQNLIKPVSYPIKRIRRERIGWFARWLIILWTGYAFFDSRLRPKSN